MLLAYTIVSLLLKEGKPPIIGSIVLGAVIIKHMLNLSDRETISQIQENMIIQYFLGYSSFTNEPPFDASLFVDIRERLNLSITTAISELVMAHHIEKFENRVKRFWRWCWFCHCQPDGKCG